MSWVTDARRRQIRAKGRIMRLTRVDKSASVTVTGFGAPTGALTLESGVASGAFTVEIMADELGRYGEPKNSDVLVDGARSYSVDDAIQVFDGDTVCGWSLICQGGT